MPGTTTTTTAELDYLLGHDQHDHDQPAELDHDQPAKIRARLLPGHDQQKIRAAEDQSSTTTAELDHDRRAEDQSSTAELDQPPISSIPTNNTHSNDRLNDASVDAP